MTAPKTRPMRERLGSWCFLFGIVMAAFGLVFIQIEAGVVMIACGLALVVASQFLHPFWRPRWKPAPPPPQPTLGDFGLAPKKGEHYTAGEAAEVHVVIWWKPMGTNTINAVLPAGTLLVVDHDHEPDMKHVTVTAPNHAALETLLVPPADRDSGTYNGYSLAVAPAVFAQRFTRF